MCLEYVRMAVKAQKVPQDTRGLPMNFDPHQFYEYSSTSVVANSSTGIEMLIWKLIPYTYIRSFAIAIDPLYKFKVSQVRISPPSRKRQRTLLSSVYDVHKRRIANSSTYANSTTGTGCARDDYKKTSGNMTDETTVAYKNNSKYTQTMYDTSRRTRPFGSDYGEAEYFRFSIASPSRLTYNVSNTHIWAKPSFCPLVKRTDDYNSHTVYYSSGGYLLPSVIEALRLTTSLDCDLLMQRRGMEYVRRAMPTSRNFNLARSIVELRDLPRSIESLQKSLRDLRDLAKTLPKGLDLFNLRTNLKNVPNEYLSYSFGWRQIYSDVMDLLVKPQRVTKRINRLITRNGLSSTFTAVGKFSDSYESSSGFTYIGDAYDMSPISTTHRVQRERTMRCTINARFQFPPIDNIRFRKTLFDSMLGIQLSPGDLYDLVPWTWLFDWFTGFGNYLHIIEEITSDPSLINFGFLSLKTEGSLETTYKYSCRARESWMYNGVVTAISDVYTPNSHSSSLDFQHYKRVDVTRLTNMKATSDPASLSLFQSTILGALFAQRSKI